MFKTFLSRQKATVYDITKQSFKNPDPHTDIWGPKRDLKFNREIYMQMFKNLPPLKNYNDTMYYIYMYA